LKEIDMSVDEKQLRGARRVAVVSVICIVVSAIIEVLLFTGTLAVKVRVFCCGLTS